MILRKQQYDLVIKFKEHADTGRSLCHQMIMGAGKTTVVAPMLALLIGDGQVRDPHNMDCFQKDGSDHLGLWYNALPEHQMALITSGCVPEQGVSGDRGPEEAR